MEQQGEWRIIQKVECVRVWNKDSYFACLQPTFGIQSVLVRQEEVLFVPVHPTHIFNFPYYFNTFCVQRTFTSFFYCPFLKNCRFSDLTKKEEREKEMFNNGATLEE